MARTKKRLKIIIMRHRDSLSYLIVSCRKASRKHASSPAQRFAIYKYYSTPAADSARTDFDGRPNKVKLKCNKIALAVDAQLMARLILETDQPSGANFGKERPSDNSTVYKYGLSDG